MAGSSSDQGATATPSSPFKYDVFLSFRGDTRRKFTDTLYHALVNKRIETFRDSEKLRIGEEIEGALLEAIERSRMSILVLCAKYPTSRWCLDELVKIMQCSNSGSKRPVLPIFFYVEPADLKYQKKSYGKAMTNHVNKGRYNHKLESWKSALFAVGNKSGLCVNKNISLSTLKSTLTSLTDSNSQYNTFRFRLSPILMIMFLLLSLPSPLIMTITALLHLLKDGVKFEFLRRSHEGRFLRRKATWTIYDIATIKEAGECSVFLHWSNTASSSLSSLQDLPRTVTMAGSSSDQGETPLSHFKYDVFLSFRGYTRLGFTDALYHALINKRIMTFRDSEKLRIGEELEGSLLKAIERSRMSILILCDQYPTSRFCLDELVKIMECSDNGRKRSVFPVYFHVEQSDVQYQINEYGKAMAAHEEKGRYNHKLEAWKSALFQVGKIYGQRCDQNTPWGMAIDNIVEEVSKRLPPEPLYIDRPLGFDSELEHVKLCLEIDSHSTCFMLGIHGDGELSKLVVELYNKIRPHFLAASFLSNVSEKTNAGGGGLEDLQKTLLSEMGEEVNTKIGRTFKGSSEIKRRLGQKRVLLVLDDVDSIQQLNSLAGGIDWFGPGSRIIITTRNEDVLDEHMLNNGFEIKKYCIVGRQVEEDDVDKGDVVGFMNNFSFLIELLNDANINIVSIIGMGGSGKTTLAQKVYDNNVVKNLFPCRGWSRVSKDYETREVLLSLLCSLKFSTSIYQNSTEEHLKKIVRNYLKGKKYLIMLDDIWEPEVWDDLKVAFPNESNGSKVLITSRNEEVANYTSSRLYKLPLLDEKESWELFCKKVFSDQECPSDLEPLGRSIIESCGGLPLAIVAIGGVVAKKKRSEREWLGVKECIHWHLTKDMTKVMDVLKLSYDSLSEELKPCFLYLGIYPEDFEIWARELIHLWMAEGFIRPQESGIPNAPEPEVVGEEYLKELVDRNMVYVSRQSSDGGVKKCLIHDLFRDLCIILSKADKFFEVCTGSNIHTLSKPQRLSLLCKEKSCMPSVETNESSTRSLFFFAGDDYSNDSLENFQSVQVLYLGGQACFQRIPCNLEAMIFLKYLKIGKTRHLRTVPQCIWSLPNLEMLDVRGWMTFCIPNNFWKLKKLRHVYIFSNGVRLPKDKEGGDSRTRTIMLNLQSLCSVDFDTPISFQFSNGRFPNLRKLGLWLDPRRENRCSWHELLLSLHHLSNLHTLKLRCCHSEFSIDATMFPLNLTKITFTVFGKLDSKSMKSLGQLPNLQVLKLLEGTIVESLDCATGDFPKLQYLKMFKVQVQRWMLEKDAMPRLRILVIWSCSELSELPEQLWSLTTLAEVRVIDPSDELENSLKDVEVNDNCDFRISYAEKH